MRLLANHHIVEFSGCDPRKINSPRLVLRAMRQLCRSVPLTTIRAVQHKFSPHGLTVVILLKESHFAFHSWPEHGYAAVDLFLCTGVPKLGPALAELRKAFGASRQKVVKVPCRAR